MKQNRPVNLDLLTLKFPVMAISSILHRISGIVLFLLFPYALYFFSMSLKSEFSFNSMRMLMDYPINKFMLWIFLAALTYHFLAGIRHMILDLGYGESLREGQNTAVFVILSFIVLATLLGIWIW